jgi:DNA invertase Pin-like site-specific DNA recombinase
MSKTGTTAIGYIRVSSAQQAEEGVSLEAQRAKLEAFAFAHDLELLSIEVDAGISGKNLKRPGIQAALAKLESGEAEALVIVKLDRLTRSTKDLGWLLEKERFGEAWTLLSLKDSIDTRTASGRMVLNILMSVAQWEREECGERTKAALQHLKTQGVKMGRPGLGLRYTDVEDEEGRRLLAEVRDECDTVSIILRLRKAGCTYQQIADQLTAEARPTKRGGAWYAGTVQKIVRRAA